MGEYPDPRPPARDEPRHAIPSAAADDPPLSKKEQQALAHSRGRICKQRRCEVCAPLRERRHQKKQQRKADAQAQAHAKGEPCGRTKCAVDVCVQARASAAPAADADAIPAETQRTAEPKVHPKEQSRREAERHYAGLPCGSEDCPEQLCIDGFAQERARRHRARRPCRSATCTNAICVAGRSAN
jgi:hypothetical protein